MFSTIYENKLYLLYVQYIYRYNINNVELNVKLYSYRAILSDILDMPRIACMAVCIAGAIVSEQRLL